MNSSNRGSNFAAAAAIAAIPVLTWCCFATLTIYAGNADEFSVAYADVALVYLPYAILLIAGLGLPGLVLSGAGLSRYRALLAALGILAWLQGNILVWDYGDLDGNAISWTTGAWRGILDTAIWIVVLIAAIRYHERLGKVLVTAAIAAFGIQLVGATVSVASGPDEILARESASPSLGNTDNAYSFSAKGNVLHIVMDGFQADIFQNILDAEDGDKLRQELRGFTLFEKNLGAYPYTQLTIPALLTGKLYRNEMPAVDFVTKTLRGNSILGAAMDAGYDVDIAAPVGLANTYRNARHTNVYGITSGYHVGGNEVAVIETAKLVDLALFRVVPHFVKALVYRDELWVFQAKVRPEEYLHMQYFSDVSFLHRFAQNMSVDRSAPVYKMIHVMLAHKPTVGNANCEFVGRLRTTRENVIGHAGCGLTQVGAIFRRMKELDVYDNSLIVLMADHGAWVPVEGLRNTAFGTKSVNAMTVAMANPVLAIKPPRSNGDLQVSTAPTSVTDIPATIADILELGVSFPGRSALKLSLDESRERLHAIYGYGDNADAPGHLFPMHEFHINGDPFDARSWRRGDTYLPGGGISAGSETE